MTSTHFPSPATSYPLSFQSAAASLPSVFARRPLFSIACSLFSENTRGGGTLTPPHQASLPKGVHFAKDCKNTETATLTTFRINTCKSVSKQRTLTTFRINTYAKPGRRGGEWVPSAIAISLRKAKGAKLPHTGPLEFQSRAYFTLIMIIRNVNSTSVSTKA